MVFDRIDALCLALAGGGIAALAALIPKIKFAFVACNHAFGGF
ncbi:MULTISPECIES: hypothetical protein [unclassified Bradyrhizobium]|nr:MULTISPECIES: hypothetical protein [unclassified Bradyrhizobium]